MSEDFFDEVKMDTIVVNIVDTWDHQQLVELYRAGGWWDESWESHRLSDLILGSFALAIASVKGENTAVGMGRVISDSVSDAYIQDLVVLPSWRGKRIGCMIVEKLLAYCRKRGIHWISLIAEPGTLPFYEQLGFQIMDSCVPLHYKIEY